MQLLFKTRDRQAHGLRNWVLVRARFALRRMAGRVSHASVQMSDVDGPRHGVDKRCRVIIKATDGTPVVVTAAARDWQSAFSLALARAVEVLKQLFLRSRRRRRAERLFIRAERHSGSSGSPA